MIECRSSAQDFQLRDGPSLKLSVCVSSCDLPLFFFPCHRKMRRFCWLEYLFIVRKWKKRSRGQVRRRPWERRQTRHAAIFLLEFSSWQERTVRMVRLFAVLTVKKDFLAGFPVKSASPLLTFPTSLLFPVPSVLLFTLSLRSPIVPFERTP